MTILHVPHASSEIPDDLRASLALSDAALADELLAMTDGYADELFARAGATLVRFPVSRLVVDVERFLDDEKEPMASRGMGAVYTVTSSGGVLRQEPTPEQRQALIDRYYVPHHRALELAIESELASLGESLLVDCHSFASNPLPHEDCQRADRPDLCIGTDAFHTPDDLVDAIQCAAEQLDLSTGVDEPFSGSLMPKRYHRRRETAFSVMLEVNRSLYLDERTGQKHAGFTETRERIQRLLEAIHAWFNDRRWDRVYEAGQPLACRSFECGPTSGSVVAVHYHGSYLVDIDGSELLVYPTRGDAIDDVFIGAERHAVEIDAPAGSRPNA